MKTHARSFHPPGRLSGFYSGTAVDQGLPPDVLNSRSLLGAGRRSGLQSLGAASTSSVASR